MRHWLIERRKSKAWTQTWLAGQVGISRSYYTQIELNQRSPSIRVAKILAEFLEFEWTCFYDEDPDLGDYPSGQTVSEP